jgi:hypothetical protein
MRQTVKLFFSLIKKSPSGCWIWQGRARKANKKHRTLPYGMFRSQTAHRAAYELLVGPIPPKGFVCHACENILCVNPAHLYIGDVVSNNKDKIGMHYKEKWRFNLAMKLYSEGEKTVKDICKTVGLSRTTIWREVKKRGVVKKIR